METLNKNGTNSQDIQSPDPRIDSPNIRVVYPSPKPKPTDPLNPSDYQTVKTVDTMPVSGTPLQPIANTESSVAKISWQDAIKQNANVFMLLGAGLLLAGYLIGKNKA